jgi:hypothetical protein
MTAIAVAYSVNVSRIVAVIAGILIAVNVGHAVVVIAKIVAVVAVTIVVNVSFILVIKSINFLCKTSLI